MHQKPPGYTVITSKAFTILTCYKIQNLAGGRGGIIHLIILSYFMIFYPIKKVCEYHLQNFFGTQYLHFDSITFEKWLQIHQTLSFCLKI